MAENCALNSDGSLKDASEIAWEYSPSRKYQAQLPEMHAGEGTPAVFSRSRPTDPKTPMPMTPLEGVIPSLKRKRGEPESRLKLKEAGRGATRIKSLNLGMSEMTFTEPAGDPGASQSEDVELEAKQKTKRARSDATKDVYGGQVEGVFKKLDGGISECRVCVENGSKKTWYTGSVTTLRTHIKRMAGDHYEKYCRSCRESGIPVNEAAIPDNVKGTGTGQGGQQPITNYTQVERKATTWDKEVSVDLVLDFIIETDQALSITDTPSFRDMMEYQRGEKHKERDVPHATYMTDHLNRRAEQVKEHLDQVLKNAPGRVSLTFDGWTSHIMVAYLAVTAHFFTADWELRSELLSFGELEGRHTGENISEELYKVIKKFGIQDKLQNLTADNLTTNDKACRELGKLLKEQDRVDFDAKSQRSPCFAHAVNLAVGAFINGLSPKRGSKTGVNKDKPLIPGPIPSQRYDESDVTAVEDDDDEIEALRRELDEIEKSSSEVSSAVNASALLLRVRSFVVKVRRCGQAKKYLKTCCEHAGCGTLALIPFCATRWGSWYNVLKRVLELQKAIIRFVNTADHEDSVPRVEAKKPKYSSYHLDDEEWEMIRIIHDVLKDAALVNDRFSSHIEPTVWNVLPIFEQLIETWKMKALDPRFSRIKDAILAGVKKASDYYNRTDLSPAYITSQYLNPSNKDALFETWDEAGRDYAKSAMEKVFDEYRSAPEVVPSAENTSAHPDLHRDPLGSHSTSPILFGEERIIEARRRRMARDSLQVLDPRAELNQYLCEPLVPTSCPVPIWWKNNAARFPTLARIALDHLPVQGSSVASERAFSSAGLDDDKRRGKISATTFGCLQFVKAHCKEKRRRELMAKKVVNDTQKVVWANI